MKEKEIGEKEREEVEVLVEGLGREKNYGIT